MNEAKTYQGCLKRNGQFLDLQGKTAVYLEKDWNASFLETDESLAQIFFEPEKGLYLLTPLQNRCVFLPSGQPLGKQRQYHLRRGMKICLQGPETEPAVLL